MNRTNFSLNGRRCILLFHHLGHPSANNRRTNVLKPVYIKSALTESGKLRKVLLIGYYRMTG